LSKQLTDLDFIDLIYKTELEKVKVVLFFGDMSSASTAMLNYLEKIQIENKKLDLFSCNIDANVTVRKQENIEAIPTIGVYSNGSRTRTIAQFMTPNEFLIFLQNIT